MFPESQPVNPENGEEVEKDMIEDGHGRKHFKKAAQCLGE